MEFKTLDLRKQLTDELKEKWYYKQVEWGLKINKQSVVFDKYFKFKLRYSEPVLDDDEPEVAIDMYINDEKEIYKTLGYYNKANRYNDGSEDELLEEILVYIANYI